MSRRLPKARQDARDMQMVVEVRAGITLTEIAARHRVHPKTVARAIARFERTQPQVTRKPLEIVEEIRTCIQADIGDLALIGFMSDDEGVRIRAMAQKNRHQKSLEAQLDRLGLMPDLRPADADWTREFASGFLQWCRGVEIGGDSLPTEYVGLLQRLLEDYIESLGENRA
jgi:hypothetical protein